MHAANLMTGNTPVLVMAGLAILAGIGCAITAAGAWRDAALLDKEGRGVADRLLGPLAQRMAPRTDIQVRQARQLLVRAGLRDEDALRKFTLARTAAVAVAVVLSVLLKLLALPLLQFLLLAVGALYASRRLPDVWIERRIASRQAAIARALPMVVDLMVLCLEVGLSVEAAFARVTQEMRTMEPLMAEEAGLTVAEMSAGLTFPQAFLRLADRIDLAELTTMARLIGQAASLGASITQSLREYSESSFTKRLMNLEEQAGQISAKLVLPLTLCMLPASLVALAGPAALAVVKAIA